MNIEKRINSLTAKATTIKTELTTIERKLYRLANYEKLFKPIFEIVQELCADNGFEFKKLTKDISRKSTQFKYLICKAIYCKTDLDKYEICCIFDINNIHTLDLGLDKIRSELALQPKLKEFYKHIERKFENV